jgi:hypothetical protein
MDPVKLHTRMDVLYFLEPNDLNSVRLTKIYRRVTAHLKSHPWLRIVPLTLLGLTVLSYLLSGVIVQVASVLQKGY